MRIFIILILLTLSSCQGKLGNKNTITLYNKNLSKDISIQDIIADYGDYSDKWIGEYGENIYQYSYSVSRYDLISYLPIINHFGWINSKNYEILLFFNQQNQFLEKRKFYNQAKSRNSLICNPKIYNCIKKVY